MTLALTSCQPSPGTLSPRAFEARWHDLIARHDIAGAKKVIEQRAKQLPDDPEVVIARANLYFRQASAPAPGFGPGGKAMAAMAGRDTASGLDTLLARRALDTLREGIQRYPGRLDIRLGLAHICQQLGLRPSEVQVVGQTVDYSLGHPADMRWSYGEPLPMPADVYVPQMLHENVRFYVDRGAPGDGEAALALGQIVMQAYPNSPYVPNDVAYYYGTQGQWEKSLEYLHRAARADSTDALVLYNLGWANEQLKRRADAVHFYRRSLTTSIAGRNNDIAESARRRLMALGATR